MGAVAAAASSAVGMSFFLAAGAKVVAPRGAREALAFAKVPTPLRSVAALTLAALELLVGLALLVVGTRLTALLALALLLPFTAFLVVLARRAPGIRCGCLGDVGEVDHVVGLGRNSLLVLLLVLALVEPPGRASFLAAVAGAQVVVLMLVVSTGLSVLRRAADLAEAR